MKLIFIPQRAPCIIRTNAKLCVIMEQRVMTKIPIQMQFDSITGTRSGLVWLKLITFIDENLHPNGARRVDGREGRVALRPPSPIPFQLFCANACGSSGQLNSRLLPACPDWDIFYDDAWTPSATAVKKSFSFQPRDYYRCKPSIGRGERKGVKSMRNRRCWLTKATNANAMEMYSADKSADQRFCNKLRIGFLMNRGSNANRTDESADFWGYDKSNGFCRRWKLSARKYLPFNLWTVIWHSHLNAITSNCQLDLHNCFSNPIKAPLLTEKLLIQLSIPLRWQWHSFSIECKLWPSLVVV